MVLEPAPLWKTVPSVAPPAEPEDFHQRAGWRLGAIGVWLLLVLALLAVVVAVADERAMLLSRAGLRMMAPRVLSLALLVPAMVMIVAAGGVDLSVGAVAALAGVVAASGMQSAGAGGAFQSALLVGLGIGVAHAVLIGLCRLPGVLVTLSAMVAARAAAGMVAGGGVLAMPFASTSGELPSTGATTIVLVACALAAAVMVQFTPFGRLAPEGRCGAPAGLARGLYLGVPYLLSALAASLMGVRLAAKIGVAAPHNAMGYELDVLLAVTVGGTALGARFGTVVGGLVGAAAVVGVRTLMVLQGVAVDFRHLVLGLALVGFVALVRLYYHVVQRLYRRGLEPREREWLALRPQRRPPTS